MPVQLRLTSVLGDVVYDTLPGWSGGQVCVYTYLFLPLHACSLSELPVE